MNTNLPEAEMIRPMNAQEVQKLVAWAGDEGWNPGVNDAQCFWNLDPDGFLAIAENDKVIGGGATIRHGESFDGNKGVRGKQRCQEPNTPIAARNGS
jgi:hypothetical protein